MFPLEIAYSSNPILQPEKGTFGQYMFVYCTKSHITLFFSEATHTTLYIGGNVQFSQTVPCSLLEEFGKTCKQEASNGTRTRRVFTHVVFQIAILVSYKWMYSIQPHWQDLWQILFHISATNTHAKWLKTCICYKQIHIFFFKHRYTQPYQSLPTMHRCIYSVNLIQQQLTNPHAKSLSFFCDINLSAMQQQTVKTSQLQ